MCHEANRVQPRIQNCNESPHGVHHAWNPLWNVLSTCLRKEKDDDNGGHDGTAENKHKLIAAIAIHVQISHVFIPVTTGPIMTGN